MNNHYIRVLYILIILTSGSYIQAQIFTQTIRGTVRDRDSQEPLKGASVTLISLNPELEVSTDENGVFKFQQIVVGRHAIRVVKTGYRDAVVMDIILNSAKEAVILIEMEEMRQELRGVTIKGNAVATKPNNDMISVSGRLFNTDQTNRFAGSFSDPSRMAANFAGVSGVGGQRNDIIIRGNSPMGLLWRLDGIDIPNPNHFSSQGSTGGPVSILNNNTLASSDFITGAFPAEYGNCLSGVFDLKMRSGNNEKREYTGQLGFNGLELGAEGPFSKKSKSSYLINYRYSTLGLFDLIGINLTFAGIPYYQDVSFKLNFPKTKTGQWTVTGIGGTSHISLLDSKKDTADLTFSDYRSNIYNGTSMAALIISNQNKINSKSYIKTSFGLTYQNRYIHVDSLNKKNEATLKYAEGSDYKKVTLHTLYNNKLSSRSVIRAGIIYSYLLTSFRDSFLNNQGTITTLRSFSGNTTLLQSYLQWKYQITSTITITPGIYGQYFMYNNTKSVEPRIGLKYSPAKKIQMSLAAGIHTQTQPLEVYTAQKRNLLTGNYVKTNDNLEFSKSFHGIAGIYYMPQKNISIKTEIYYQRLTNIPVDGNQLSSFSMLNFGAEFSSLPANDSLKNSGTGENKGIEITLERFFSKGLYWLFTGSFFDSKYTGSDGKTYNTAFNGKYVMNLLGGYEYTLGKNKNKILSINIKSTYAGGRRYTPIDETESLKRGETVYFDSKAYSAQFKNFFRADLRIGFKKNAQRITQEWAIDIQNVFNIQNPLQQRFDVLTGKITTQYQQGFLPVGLYRINF